MNIVEIKLWFEAVSPNPNDRQRAIQIGQHLEETAGFAHSLGDPELMHQLARVANYYREIGRKHHTHADRRELLASCCNSIIALVGVAHMFGFDIVHAMSEVNRSNWSKFADGRPVFDHRGNLSRSENYSRPNLEGFY